MFRGMLLCPVFLACLCVAAQARTRVRPCRDAFINDVILSDVTHRYTPLLRNSSSGINITLQLLAEWKLKNLKGSNIDGFLLHFRKITSGSSVPTLLPNNICNLQAGSFWQQSGVVCSDTGKVASCQGGIGRCQCHSPCQNATYANCRGIEYWMKTYGMVSINSETRKLVFDVSFHQEYILQIIPYHRGAVALKYTDGISALRAYDCSALLATQNHINQSEASKLCCAAGIPQYFARGPTFDPPRPNFKRGALEVTVHWFQPINSRHVIAYQVTASSKGNHPVITGRISPRPSITPGVCGGELVEHDATLTPMFQNTTYKVVITTFYKKGKVPCDNDKCYWTSQLNVTDVDVCDPSYAYCDANATCSTIVDVTRWNVTCTCASGYQDNGVRGNESSDGCTALDYCSLELNPCAPDATCERGAGRGRGTVCRCPPLHSGDGLVSGGCHSNVWKLVVVGATCVVIILLIILLLLRHQWKKHKRNYNFKWSQFVANRSLECEIEGKLSGQELCLPTFGDKWELDRDDIILGDVIGRGNYGVVYAGTYKSSESEKEPVAVKMLQEGASSGSNIQDFLFEIGFMLNVGEHPNVVSVRGCCTTNEPVYCVTELLKYGDLLHFLYDARRLDKCAKEPLFRLTEHTLYGMSAQIADGMYYLTRNRIIHGDLAARNVLVGEGLVCKISDFGLANDVYRYGVIRGQTERCVPIKWVSPERMMRGKVPITSKSDVWSFGNLLYEMVTLGCPPYPDVEPEDLLKKLQSGFRMQKPVSCGDHMFSIMTKCWRWNSFERPSFKRIGELLSHPTLRNKESAISDKINTIEYTEVIPLVC